MYPFLLISSVPVCLVQTAPVPTPPALTVDEAVRLAASNNAQVKAAILDVDAARLGLGTAKAPANPTAFFAPGITSISGTGEEFLIQQPLEINGTRRARTGVARAGLSGAQALALVTLRDVIFNVKSAYVELARAREKASIARDGLSVAGEFDRIARRQVEEGARPGIDLAQTGLEVSRAQRQVTLIDGDVTASAARLNTLLGRAPETPVGTLSPLAIGPATVLDSLSPPVTPPVDASPVTPPTTFPAPTGAVDLGTVTLLNQALNTRSEIQGASATGEQLRQEAGLLRAEGRPDLVPQFRIGYVTRGLQPAQSGNGAGIGIALTLPLDYGTRRQRIAQTEQAARAQDARVIQAQNEVRQEVIQALARLRASESVVQAYQGGTLEQARRLLDASRTGFQEGRTNVVALLEAQRSFRAVQSEYADALGDAAIARAQLERAVGGVPASLLPVVKK